jgi:hypothetical protein
MTQKQFYCPACKKTTSERGILLHFRQALSGFDRTWNPPNLHINWARNNGIEVDDSGYLFNFDKLNDILRKELSKQ